MSSFSSLMMDRPQRTRKRPVRFGELEESSAPKSRPLSIERSSSSSSKQKSPSGALATSSATSSAEAFEQQDATPEAKLLTAVKLSFSCLVCQKEFRYGSDYENHMQSQHSESDVPPPPTVSESMLPTRDTVSPSVSVSSNDAHKRLVARRSEGGRVIDVHNTSSREKMTQTVDRGDGTSGDEGSIMESAGKSSLESTSDLIAAIETRRNDLKVDCTNFDNDMKRIKVLTEEISALAKATNIYSGADRRAYEQCRKECPRRDNQLQAYRREVVDDILRWTKNVGDDALLTRLKGQGMIITVHEFRITMREWDYVESHGQDCKWCGKDLYREILRRKRAELGDLNMRVVVNWPLLRSHTAELRRMEWEINGGDPSQLPAVVSPG